MRVCVRLRGHRGHPNFYDFLPRAIAIFTGIYNDIYIYMYTNLSLAGADPKGKEKVLQFFKNNNKKGSEKTEAEIAAENKHEVKEMQRLEDRLRRLLNQRFDMTEGHPIIHLWGHHD